jgi:hypothetical protein
MVLISRVHLSYTEMHACANAGGQNGAELLANGKLFVLRWGVDATDENLEYLLCPVLRQFYHPKAGPLIEHYSKDLSNSVRNLVPAIKNSCSPHFLDLPPDFACTDSDKQGQLVDGAPGMAELSVHYQLQKMDVGSMGEEIRQRAGGTSFVGVLASLAVTFETRVQEELARKEEPKGFGVPAGGWVAVGHHLLVHMSYVLARTRRSQAEVDTMGSDGNTRQSLRHNAGWKHTEILNSLQSLQFWTQQALHIVSPLKIMTGGGMLAGFSGYWQPGSPLPPVVVKAVATALVGILDLTPDPIYDSHPNHPLHDASRQGTEESELTEMEARVLHADHKYYGNQVSTKTILNGLLLGGVKDAPAGFQDSGFEDFSKYLTKVQVRLDSKKLWPKQPSELFSLGLLSKQADELDKDLGMGYVLKI